MKRTFALAALCVVIGCTDDPVAPLERASVSAAAPLLSPVTAGGATVTDLGSVAGFTSSAAKSISANGMIVGSATGGTPAFAALLFNPPALVYDQGQFPNDHAIEGSSTNDLGQVAGYGVHDFRNRAYVGAAGWLPLLTGGVNQFGGYLNNGGEVVGTTTFDVANVLPGHATLWLPGEEYSAVDLGTFGGRSIEPLAMAPNMLGDFRIIVGRYSASVFNGFTAVVWQNGSWSELPGPANCARNYTQANDVSDNGIIVGGEFFCGHGAVIWENGQLRTLPDGAEARGIATLAAGRILIVGTSDTGQPVVWYDDGRGGFIGQQLPVLSGHSGGDAYDVNAFGQIVGRTANGNGPSRAVIWNFTPPDLTLSGSNVTVIPIDASRGLPAPISVTFATVTGAGITSARSGLMGAASSPPAPQGFQLGNPARYYEVSTTASVTAPIAVCIGYGGIIFAVEANLRLLHGNGSGGWTDITTSQDQVSNRICGVVSSLSPFIVVELGNTPPSAVNDQATTNEDFSATINVLANDSDANSDALSVVSVTSPAHGTAVIANGGTAVRYTPTANYNGTDVFSYSISDGRGGQASALVNVAITAANDSPSALNDAATTVAPNAVTVQVLANDSDSDGDVLSISGVTQPAHGNATVVQSGQAVAYSPAAGYSGPDQFTYTVRDALGASAMATVAIVVTAPTPPAGVNLAPVADDDDAETSPLNTVVIGVLDNDSDPDGNSLRVTAVGRPAHGIAYIHSGRKIVYTPGLFFTGVDVFTYRISDGRGGTATASVTVTVVEPRADLALQLEADVKVTSFSRSITITVNEFNFGPMDSPFAVLEIPKVNGLTFVSDENGYCFARYNGTVSCLLGSLESDADRSRLRLKFRANSPGTYMISGKINGFLKDPVNRNNVATVEAAVR